MPVDFAKNKRRKLLSYFLKNVMKNIQSPSDVINAIPLDLPIPTDDGACQHLDNRILPAISLWSTDDQEINLSRLAGWNVVFCYPMTGRPGFAIPDGWIQIPGAAGCTPQVCSYRDKNSFFIRNGVSVFGLSTQTTDVQKEAVKRLELPYPLLSDSNHSFAMALKLPLLEIKDLKLIKRLTLIIKDNVIIKCFYPVFPPDENVNNVIRWLSNNQT